MISFYLEPILFQCCFEHSGFYGAGSNFSLSETVAHCNLLILCVQFFKGSLRPCESWAASVVPTCAPAFEPQSSELDTDANPIAPCRVLYGLLNGHLSLLCLGSSDPNRLMRETVEQRGRLGCLRLTCHVQS